jgi:hypothetical protein
MGKFNSDPQLHNVIPVLQIKLTPSLRLDFEYSLTDAILTLLSSQDYNHMIAVEAWASQYSWTSNYITA